MNKTEARKILQEIEPQLREMGLRKQPDALGSLCRALASIDPKIRGEEAFELAKKNATDEEPRDWATMGRLFQDGIGVLKDEKEAVKWYTKAAEQGDAYGQSNLGACYFNGTGVAKDEKVAVKWYTKAADKGDGWSQNKLGNCYANGIGVEKDYKKALDWFRKGAEQEDGSATGNVGRCYETGTGVAKDEKEAVKWYTKAADKGDGWSQDKLGNCYANGIGVEKDYKKALEWYRKGAEQGDGSATVHVGWCYANGKGVVKDEKEAVKWYTKAAEMGDAWSQNSLGACYYNGTGVTKDYKEAVKWYTKAAESKYEAAMYQLGQIQFAGLLGKSSDDSKCFQALAELPLQSKGSWKNFWIGKGCLEMGNFAKTKEALSAAGNQHGPHGQNIELEKMRLASSQSPVFGSVVEILGDNSESCGTGVFCGEEGWVLTAAHVVAGHDHMQIRNTKMQTWLVEQVCPEDFSQDLVLLKTPAKDQRPVGLADRPPRMGENVVMLGHPLGVVHLIETTGVVEFSGSATQPMISVIPSMPGNSGSPIFNEDNELVGIATRASYFSQTKSQWVSPKSWSVALPNLKKILDAGEKPESFRPVSEIVSWSGKSRDWDAESSKGEKALALGQTYLGESFQDREPSKAAAIFVVSAEKGDAAGQNLLADMYYRGDAVPKDTEKAVHLWHKAAEGGNTDAMVRLGAEYDAGSVLEKDRCVSLSWYRKAAADGNTSAMANTGVYYLNGWGTVRDYNEGAKWIKQSAEKGNAFGQYVYGLLWENGWGVKISDGLAAQWYEAAAKNGNTDGMVKYGHCLEYGQGVKENKEEAIQWFKKALQGGNLQGGYRLAAAYSNGNGVAKDFSKAIETWKECARKGHKASIEKLSFLGVELEK